MSLCELQRLLKCNPVMHESNPESREAWGISACKWTLERISAVQHRTSFPKVMFVFEGSGAVDKLMEYRSTRAKTPRCSKCRHFWGGHGCSGGV